MNKSELSNLIAQTKGRFFSIKFRKSDGTVRVANGKDFYTSLLCGGDSTHKESNSRPFVDRNKGSFISANGDRVIAFRCGSLSWPS